VTEPASRWENLAFDQDGRLVDLGGPLEFVDFGPPPPVVWVAVMDFGNAFGQRVALLNSNGPVYGLRVASEVFEDAGGWYVHVVGEDQWWDWVSRTDDQKPPRPAPAVCVQARHVWVEAHEPWAGSPK
jgi:hypothetical protein